MHLLVIPTTNTAAKQVRTEQMALQPQLMIDTVHAQALTKPTATLLSLLVIPTKYIANNEHILQIITVAIRRKNEGLTTLIKRQGMIAAKIATGIIL